MNFDSSVLQVAIEDIIPNRFQPRLSFEDSSLKELSESIRQHGIIQPLVLRKIGDKYEIIAGERRYKAATMAGLSSVPAVISKIDDKTSAEVAVVENVQRRDLTAIEEALSYKALLDQGFMSQEQLAKRMGLSQGAISNKLRLLNLAKEVQDAILENKISERHARALLVVKEPEAQIKWLNRIIDERLTVRQLGEELRKEYKGDNVNNNIDIEQIKQSATDISSMTSEPIVTSPTPVAPSFTMGPIDLGQKTTSKFFNSLEDQAANMQMTEAINPFAQNATLMPSSPPTVTEPTGLTEAKISTDIPKIGGEPSEVAFSPIPEPKIPDPMAPVGGFMETPIDSLDSLDFEPPKATIDITPAKNKITNLVNDLKAENFNVEIQEKQENGQVVYTIILKETEI
ncbi:MAG: ParB/RepB/Spo0J family partition protein [Bacilli bacterium]|nr:ParB/RepB/Spo0J family partition protein [Bacilli bacterium]